MPPKLNSLLLFLRNNLIPNILPRSSLSEHSLLYRFGQMLYTKSPLNYGMPKRALLIETRNILTMDDTSGG